MTPETKTSIITVRVTDEERAQLEAWAKAEDRSISGLIHYRLFKDRPNVTEDESEF